MPAQGELRGPDAPKARHTGGDWDSNAEDLAPFTEPNPGEICVLCCRDRAPIGLSICTPCWRLRVRIRNKLNAQRAVSPEAWRLSLERHGLSEPEL